VDLATCDQRVEMIEAAFVVRILPREQLNQVRHAEDDADFVRRQRACGGILALVRVMEQLGEQSVDPAGGPISREKEMATGCGVASELAAANPTSKHARQHSFREGDRRVEARGRVAAQTEEALGEPPPDSVLKEQRGYRLVAQPVEAQKVQDGAQHVVLEEQQRHRHLSLSLSLFYDTTSPKAVCSTILVVAVAARPRRDRATHPKAEG